MAAAKNLAVSLRAEERRVHLAEKRRAYAAFLAAGDGAGEAITRIWFLHRRQGGTSPAEALAEVSEAMFRLHSAVHEVLLLGPESLQGPLDALTDAYTAGWDVAERGGEPWTDRAVPPLRDKVRKAFKDDLAASAFIADGL
jgi:hypothetical protein